ncbi:MAG: acyltransferase family protein [Sphingomicrobium sp.]
MAALHPGGMRLRSIDMVRGLAALAVVFAHVDDRFAVGAAGVDFFFVVSGFVMAHVSRNRTPGQFLKDRAWRIFPIYWVIAVPWILLALSVGAIAPLGALNSLMLWPHWFGYDSTFIGVTWTLVYELAFYLSVAVAIRLKNPAFPLVMFAVALIARPFTDHPLIAFAGHPIAIEFLFGIAIAHAPKQRVAGSLLMALGIGWLLLFPNAQLHDFLGNPDSGYGLRRVLLWGLPAAMIIYGLVVFEQRLAGRWARPLLVLGAASYSIYLVHSLAAALVDWPWPAEIAVAVGSGMLLWALVEWQLLAMRHKVLRQPAQAATGTAAIAASVAVIVPPPSIRSPS